MAPDTIIRWTRAALLVGLLAYFAGMLYAGLAQDERAGGFGKLHQGAGLDPGIHVLLTNHASKINESMDAPRWHEDKVELSILQAAVVLAPDDATNSERRLELKGGSRLTIIVDGPDGLILNSRGWGSDGREYRWSVNRVRVQPVATFPAPGDDEGALLDAARFEAADRDAVFALAGRRYRGCAEIWWHSPKDLAVVNLLPLEAYVEGVLAVEMSPSFPLEALKAQAIVSRSYAYARALRSRQAKQPFDLVDGVEDQDYHGAGNSSRVVAQAALDTRGIITCTDLSQGAYPFAPLFCASSGGWTADARGVLREPLDAYGHPLPIPLMMPVKDDYCLAGAQGLGYLGSHWSNTIVLKPADIRAAVAKYLKSRNDPRQVGYIKDVRVSRRDRESNRVLMVQIQHSLPDGQPIEIPAHDFRLMMGPAVIKSTLWTSDSPKRIDAPDLKTKNYQITTCGYGHGVGMSQISAWEMARQGANARAIIEYFYRGVSLRTAW
jgi:SpoIID/LytB domain protein